MILSIKNMVCPRCILVVKDELEALNLHSEKITMGEIFFSNELSDNQLTQVKKQLLIHGFEVLDDRKAMLIEKVKNVIIDVIHGAENIEVKRKYSDIISQELQVDYNYLSAIFSTKEGITIEHYIILQRIERAKELMVYNELNLSEISYKLGYRNVQHLSTQFKKITGLTPSYFKNIKEHKRKSLDNV